MKYGIYFIIIVVLIGLSGGVFNVFPIFRTVPQLLMLLLAIVAAEQKNSDFIFIALAAGFMMDMVSSVAIGSFTLSYFFIGFGVKYLFENVLLASNSWKHLPWIVSIAIAAQSLWVWLYNGTLARTSAMVPAFSVSEILVLSVGSIIYTLIVFFPVYWLVERLTEYLVRLEQKKKY
jgi:rod shape-determining protein MreD